MTTPRIRRDYWTPEPDHPPTVRADVTPHGAFEVSVGYVGEWSDRYGTKERFFKCGEVTAFTPAGARYAAWRLKRWYRRHVHRQEIAQAIEQKETQ